MSSIQRRKAFDITYMSMALAMSKLSYARRKQVGCVIVSKDDQIISQGFNGTPSGMDNNCEWDWCSAKGAPIKSPLSDCKEENVPFEVEDDIKTKCNCCVHYRLKTKPYVLHAESNAIAKCARSNQSTKDATLYVTLSPCIECAKTIVQAGIKRVVYAEYYDNPEGIELLESVGITVEQLDIDEK